MVKFSDMFAPVFSNVLRVLNHIKLWNDHFHTGQTQKMNLFQSITSALDNALAKDPTAGTLYLLVYFALYKLCFGLPIYVQYLMYFSWPVKFFNKLLLHSDLKS